MIGFKAFNKNLTCRGFQFEIGHTYELECEPIPCKQGFHFCKSISETYKYYDMSENTRICKVVAMGDIATDDEIKYCTNKIVICEEITENWKRKGNATSTSTGYCNSGNYNSGNHNSGIHNSGDWNSGNYNSGNHNSGHCNSGDWNSGNYNSGYWNIGDYNIGNYNSGNWNKGDWNSGNYNSGYWNSGEWNTSDYNSGIFNTEDHNPYIFDKPSNWTYDQWLYSDARKILLRITPCTEWINSGDMTNEEKEKHPSYKICGGYFKEINRKEAAQEWWNNLTDAEKNIIYALPNFDMGKFKMCVGLD